MIHTFAGGYELDLALRELRRRGRVVPLQPKAYELLVLLVEERDRTLSKEELLDRLWPDAVVGTSSLTRLVSLARAAVNDPPQAGRVIRTVPRYGYRFVADVETAAETEAEIETEAAASAPPRGAGAPESSPSTPHRVDAPARTPAEESPAQSTIAPVSEPARSTEARAEPVRVAEGARSQISLLAYEVDDSALSAARSDPEEWRERWLALQRGISGIVERHGGHLAQLHAEGAIVHFGHPVSYEDDAERAIRAALEIAASGESQGISIGCGVHTGTVVLDALGDGQRDHVVAIGADARLPGEIRRHAGPGEVVVSESTLELVGERFVRTPAARLAPDSGDGGIALYRIDGELAARDRLDASSEPLTPFVGRQQELALLLDRFERVRDGEGQALLVMGEPGVGKSRLARHLGEQIASEPHLWIECRCSARTTGSSLYPIAEMLRERLQEQVADDARGRAALDGLDPAVRAAVTSLLEAPSGPVQSPLPLATAEGVRERTLGAVVEWLRALGEETPVVLVVEDVHWVDPSTLELLGMLVEQSAAGRVLMLATARPEFEAPWPLGAGWTPVVLGPLRDRDARELVARASTRAPLDDAAVDRIVARGGGIPFFLEEVARTLAQAGEEDVSAGVPMTLRDSLEARLERAGEARPLAQIASLMGPECSFALLAEVAECEPEALRHQLRVLIDAGLLVGRGTPPAAHYAFRHALIQDTAAESLLRGQRRSLHQRIARAMAAHFPELVERQPETLASHYESAGDAAAAIRAYRRAAENAGQRSANAEALAHIDHAEGLLVQIADPTERGELELGVRVSRGMLLLPTHGYASPEVIAEFERAKALCRPAVVDEDHASLMGGLAGYYLVKGDMPTATEYFERLRTSELAREAGSLRDWANTLHGLCLFWSGRPGEAVAAFGALFSEDASADSVDLQLTLVHEHQIVGRSIYAHALWTLGRAEQAERESEQAVAFARQLGQPYSLAFALNFAGALRIMRREVDRALAYADETIAVSHQHGYALWQGSGAVVRGWALGQTGDLEAAQGELQAGTAIAAGSGAGLGISFYTALLAETCLHGDQIEACTAFADGALATTATQRVHYWDSELLRLRGEARAKLGDVDGAEASLREAMELARAQGAIALELRAAVGLARLWSETSEDHARGHALVAPLLGRFEEGRDLPDIQVARAVVAGDPGAEAG